MKRSGRVRYEIRFPLSWLQGEWVEGVGDGDSVEVEVLDCLIINLICMMHAEN